MITPSKVGRENGRLVLRNVRAIDPSRAFDETVDVVVEEGRVERIGQGASKGIVAGERTSIIEAAGAWLLPGLIDMHVHLREPGFEHKEDIASGLRAAAAGGFVRVCAMPNTRPVNDTRVVTEWMVARARSVGGVRLHPIGAITVGQKGEQLTEMGDLREGGAVAVSDDGRCVMNSGVMRRALEYARAFDLPVIQHAEDHTLTEGAQMHEGVVSTRLGLRGWPRVAEDVIVARDLLLLAATGSRYHIAHASTEGSAAMLREAKSRGLRATAEVTPHHLLLTEAALLGYDTMCKVNPPLREESDCDALWRALADGTIDCIATDHAPHGGADKDCEFVEAAPGLVGLELCLPLLATAALAGRLPVARLVEALTVGPAKALGLPVPSLRQGGAADMCLFDPKETWVPSRQSLQSKSLNSPYVGKPVRGRVTTTIVDGQVVFERRALGGQTS